MVLIVCHLSNEKLSIGVKQAGAELTSVKSKESGYEFLWQGNPDIWYGQSPILFPIVGRLADDKYLLNGVEYTIPKHGFARRSKFEFVAKTDDSLVFRLSDNEETKKLYPFEFDLIVTFRLIDNALEVNHKVVNKSADTMYFSLGAHPGFNCEIGDTLRFEQDETLSTQRINSESLRIPETYPVLENSKDIVITKDIFNEDALILSGYKSKKITLTNKSSGRTVEFTFGDAPYLGIWAKPGAPYVCIEPWFGVNDSIEKYGEFKNKEGINALQPGEAFEYAWKAVFNG